MLVFETYSIYPLLQFNQIMTTVARMPRELAVRVMRSADPEERARRAGAYILLEKMLKKHADGFKSTVESIVKPEFGAIFDSGSFLSSVRYDTYGKPYFEGREHVSFNLSHSHHLVSCALCLEESGTTAKPVGIDTQKVSLDTERAERVANRYFTDGEKAILSCVSTDKVAYCTEFTRIWTRKEALLKYWGVGLPKISQADTEQAAQHGCQYLEKEETVSFRDLNGKTVEEHYITAVCAPQEQS